MSVSLLRASEVRHPSLLCADVVDETIKIRKCGREDLAEAVYALLQILPQGTLVTYASIANVLGINARFVANILRQNPNPIIVPCHKVVKSNMSLGGYTLFGRKSPEFKAELLKVIEGIKFRKPDRVPKDCVRDVAEVLQDP